MRENSRVPPSRPAPDDAARPGDQVPAASPAPEEPSPETAARATAGQPGPAEPAGLPRRVRGSNGLRPPVRVERPTFSDSMLERVRAAVAAETDGEPDEPTPPRSSPAKSSFSARPDRPMPPPSRSRKALQKRLPRPSGHAPLRVPECHSRQPLCHFP